MAELKGRNWSAASLALLVAGVAAILAVHMILSQLLGRSLTDGLLKREGIVAQEFLNSILAAEDSTDKLFAQPQPSPALQSFGTHVRSLPGIVRANIYSPDGFIRHSSEANLVGVHFSDNKELGQAFAGKITSALEEIQASDKSEHLALSQLDGDHLIESYVPVTSPSGSVVAVVEFYRKDSWIGPMVAEMNRGIWIAAGLSSMIFALVMLVALRRR
ncbi:hypothetical protein [Aestuariivirga sp.]|uniref:hypothetical protein n=1 Tax=Aestuariivirga sp. TaxID=2650926 RepID=UPI003593D511